MDFKELVKIQVKGIEKETIIHYPEVRDLCYREYSGHKNGCPNRSKCDFLNVPSFDIIAEYGSFDYFYLIYAEFDFKKYLEIMKEIHPQWTERQLRNVLYWQSSIKRMLSNFINNLDLASWDYVLGCGSGLKIKNQKRVGSMENSYINVFSTCKLNGIKLEIHPRNKIYLVCLLCAHEPYQIKKQLILIES